MSEKWTDISVVSAKHKIHLSIHSLSTAYSFPGSWCGAEVNLSCHRTRVSVLWTKKSVNLTLMGMF